MNKTATWWTFVDFSLPHMKNGGKDLNCFKNLKCHDDNIAFKFPFLPNQTCKHNREKKKPKSMRNNHHN